MQAYCIHRLRLILPSLTLYAAKITLQGVCLQIAFFCQGAWHGVFRRAVSPHCIHYINVSPSGRRPHALACLHALARAVAHPALESRLAGCSLLKTRMTHIRYY